jgi:hypothetical protein
MEIKTKIIDEVEYPIAHNKKECIDYLLTFGFFTIDENFYEGESDKLVESFIYKKDINGTTSN